MLKSEYIIWRCECAEALREDYPNDSDKMIEIRVNAIEKAIRKTVPEFFEGIEEVNENGTICNQCLSAGNVK